MECKKGMLANMVAGLISANDNRVGLYSFLSTIYSKELTKETLEEIQEKHILWLRLANISKDQDSELAEAFGTLGQFASSLKTESLDKLKLQLDGEYAGLFLGSGLPSPRPLESVYTSREHLAVQKASDDVSRAYQSAGIDKISEFSEPEDHISTELQFMAYLSYKTREALGNSKLTEANKYLEMQRDFLNDHLTKWVPMLVVDILKKADRQFYKAIAKITEGYVKIDVRAVSAMIDNLPSSSAVYSKA